MIPKINRPTIDRNLITVPGTQKIHCVNPVSHGIVKTRNLSCFCKACQGNNEELCESNEYVEDWQKKHLLGETYQKSVKTSNKVCGTKKEHLKK